MGKVRKIIRILVIYDISSERKRTKVAKYLLGYGERVQESAFEAVVTTSDYHRILKNIGKYINKEIDSIRIYKLSDQLGTTLIGKNIVVGDELYTVM